MKKIKLYVGCALNNAPEEFKSKVLELRSKLSKDPRYEVLEFLGASGTAEDVYRRDINECVENADLMLAIVDEPSLGLGYEMSTHCKKNKRPLFAVAHKDSSVSRLILGIHGEGKFGFGRYENLSDVPRMLEAWSNS